MLAFCIREGHGLLPGVAAESNPTGATHGCCYGASAVQDTATQSLTWQPPLLCPRRSACMLDLQDCASKVEPDLASPPPPQRMLELYAYERSRAPGAFSDAVYNANAHVVLHDDPAYRLESVEATGELTVQLLDADRTEVPAGAPLFCVGLPWRLFRRHKRPPCAHAAICCAWLFLKIAGTVAQLCFAGDFNMIPRVLVPLWVQDPAR